MLEPWVSDVVVALFGVVIGALLNVSQLVHGPDEPVTPRQPGESRAAWAVRTAQQAAREGREISGPERYVAVAVYAVVGLLILALVVGPIEMSWTYLLVGIGIGYALLQIAYRLSKSGRLPALRETLVERVIAKTLGGKSRV